jgi:hypothetical protein
MLKKVKILLITFLKNNLIKLGLLNSISDYNLFTDKQEILLKFYLKLLTVNVNLKLTDYQQIEFCY